MCSVSSFLSGCRLVACQFLCSLFTFVYLYFTTTVLGALEYYRSACRTTSPPLLLMTLYSVAISRAPLYGLLSVLMGSTKESHMGKKLTKGENNPPGLFTN
jgi:hypothetical protein